MASILSILNRLEATSSRLEKERILTENKGNQLLKTAFRLALDPNINFYIKAVPQIDGNRVWPMTDLESTFEMLEVGLAGRVIRGTAARDRVAMALGTLETSDGEVVRRVLGRNLRCGVSESTVQKIWPDLQLTYPCMLVSPMSDSTKVKFPCIVQTKMDGMRFNAHVLDGKVTFKSRAGKELDFGGLPIEADFQKMPPAVYDGELLVADCDRKTGNGILTKFQKGTGTPAEGQHIRAKVWDVIAHCDFQNGESDIVCVERFTHLSGSLKRVRPATITLVQTWLDVKSLEDAQRIYTEQLAQGEEGIILKDPLGPWEDKRVKHQVKMKAELEADLRVTGIIPGAGKYEGKIGSLMVESKDGVVTTAVGTGLSDEDRSKDPSEYMGKIVAVKYNALITDKKTKAKSLFLPVFVEVREDKVHPDAF